MDPAWVAYDPPQPPDLSPPSHSPGKCQSTTQALGGTQPTGEDSGDREGLPRGAGAEAGKGLKGTVVILSVLLARQLSSNPWDPLGGRS